MVSCGVRLTFVWLLLLWVFVVVLLLVLLRDRLLVWVEYSFNGGSIVTSSHPDFTRALFKHGAILAAAPLRSETIHASVAFAGDSTDNPWELLGRVASSAFN
jgi:hypothetical protein